MDNLISRRKWTLMTAAKYIAIPIVLVVLVSAYLGISHTRQFELGKNDDSVAANNVELIAGVVGAVTEHKLFTIANIGKKTDGNAWLSLQKSSKQDAVISSAKRLSEQNITATKGKDWEKASSLLDKYMSTYVGTEEQGAAELTDKSAGRMNKDFGKIHAALIGLIKAPGADSLQDSPNSYTQTVSMGLTTSQAFILTMLALMTLIVISMLVSSLLATNRLYSQLGGTPQHLQYVADDLSGTQSRFRSINFGSDYTGIMSTLYEIAVKLEEQRAGKRLAKQLNGRLGHSEHNTITTEKENLDKETAQEELANDLDNIISNRCDDNNETSYVEQKINSASEPPQAMLDELNELRLLNDKNKERVAAVLEIAKYISKGDLTRSSGVSGDDDIGQMAHFQALNIAALTSKLTTFGDQSKSLKKSAKSLIDINDHMTHSSVQTAEQAELVSSSAEEISQNVDSVALAVKEMSASIKEISEHTAEAAQVAEHAVVLASDTDATVRKLSESSTAIDAVIKVINSIAEQTNLLALNATIEAARAGDAGKGFAVVANEVKELAKETARATEEIAQQIATIQSDSQDAVTVIGDISKIIDRVNEIQSTIAAAVEEQSVTTAEINRSINDVSHGSSQIAKNVSDVAETANENKGSVETAQEMAHLIISVSNDLDEMLAGYKVSSVTTRKKAA